MLKNCETEYLEYDESGTPTKVDVHLEFVNLTTEEVDLILSLRDKVLSKQPMKTSIGDM